MEKSMRRLGLLAAVAALSSGCTPFTGPDCIDETRGLSAAARLTSVAGQPEPADTGRAHLSLDEGRNHRSKRTSYQRMSWFVGSSLARSQVTAIHLHETGSERLVLAVPIDTTYGPPFVITQSPQGQPYPGPLAWRDFDELLGNGKIYLDVHTIQHPEGELRGTFLPEYPNWREFMHAYCS